MTDTAVTVEDPVKVDRHRPPYWCHRCDTGQAGPACWQCTGPCELTPGREYFPDGEPKHKPGSLAARHLPGCSVWYPENSRPGHDL